MMMLHFLRFYYLSFFYFSALNMWANTTVFLLCAALTLSLIVIVVLIYSRDICKGKDTLLTHCSIWEKLTQLDLH